MTTPAQAKFAVLFEEFGNAKLLPNPFRSKREALDYIAQRPEANATWRVVRLEPTRP